MITTRKRKLEGIITEMNGKVTHQELTELEGEFTDDGYYALDGSYYRIIGHDTGAMIFTLKKDEEKGC